MAKQIESIFVNRKHANKTYISVNFGSRYSAGNIEFDKATRTYKYSNLTDEQIAEARALAFDTETKRWENWTRTETKTVNRELIEDTREDIRSNSEYKTTGEWAGQSEIFG